MYKSEQAFSKALVAELRKHGYMVQRIESPETGVGIPDLVAIKDGYYYWIELKCDNAFSGTVKWRKGQQAWALEYLRHTKQPTITLVAFKDLVLCIRMSRHFKNNSVTASDYDIIKLREVAQWLSTRLK